MSRIGKMPIQIPEGVEVKINNNIISVKKNKNQLQFFLNSKVSVFLDEKEIKVDVKKEINRNLWGVTRSIINNMVIGVTKGFEKKLEIEGVGFNAQVNGDKLVMKLGFSHPIEYQAPEGIKFEVKKNLITVSGIDKQIVGQAAAEIREFKKPEPYKGKGIHYLGEHIRRKEGKKAVASEGAK